jgi:anti-sigma factor RsiW
MADRAGSHISDERLQLYLDRELGPADRARVERHLTECKVCSGRLAGLRAFFASIEGLPELPLARDLAPSVVGALRRRPIEAFRARWAVAAQALVALSLLAWVGTSSLLSPVPLERELLLGPWEDFSGEVLSWSARLLDEWVSYRSEIQALLQALDRAADALPDPATAWIWLAIALFVGLTGNGVLLRVVVRRGAPDGRADRRRT